MKAWFAAVLMMTFTSGSLIGFSVGKNAAPKPGSPDWKDGYLEQLQRRGVDQPGDLEKAREILEEYDARIRKMKSDFDQLYRAQLSRYASDAERRIREILDRYEAGGVKPR